MLTIQNGRSPRVASSNNGNNGLTGYTTVAFAPTTGQSSFTLSQAVPASLQANTILEINALTYEYGQDFWITNNTLTWSGPFQLDQEDRLVVHIPQM